MVAKPFLFYIIWLTTNKVSLPGATNAEMAASSSSWTCQGTEGGIQQTSVGTRGTTMCGNQEHNWWAMFN